MMLLDTNVLSELMRPAPNPRVVHWVSSQPARALFTTAITHAEILLGIELLAGGRRRRTLEERVAAMFAEDFEHRILPFDDAAAPAFAAIVARRRRSGRPIRHADAQIAAIARTHGAGLVTRNIGDFADCEIALTNPWNP
jgi:predicted nucleic acid-binding protein